MFSFRSHRRLLVLTIVAGLIVASCGGDGERSRNVETIAATACTKKGATKTVSKLDYVCGTAPTGKVWFSVVGKLTTKGAKACKPLGKYEAVKSRVCGTVKKSSVWVKVAPLPVAATGGGDVTTTLPSATSTLAQSTTASGVPTGSPQESRDVATALAPAPQPTTVEKFVELLVPQPVQAQATPVAPAGIKVAGGVKALANGGVPNTPFNVAILDQNDSAFASSGITVVVTSSRPDVTLTNAVATTNDNGIANFDNLRIDGVAGPVELHFAADFGATTSVPITLNPGQGVRLGLGNEASIVVVGEPFPSAPRISVYDKDDNLVQATGTKIAATYDGEVLQTAIIAATGYAEFNRLRIDEKLATAAGKSAEIDYSAVDEAALEDVVQTVTLVAGEAAELSVVTQPSTSAQAGFILGMQPAVRMFDKNGNPIGKAGTKIVAEVVCPANVTCALDGKRTIESDDNGVARFTDLVVSGVAGEYSIIFFNESSGLAALSGPISLSAGSAVAIVATKTTGVFKHGETVTSAFELQAIDKWANPVTDFDGLLEVATEKSIDFAIPQGTKFIGGVAKVDVNLRGTAGPIEFSFLSAGRSSKVYEASLVAGKPATIEVLTKPGSVSAGSTLSPVLAARFRDSANNVVQVASRPLKLTMSGATTFEEAALTNSSGIAVFSITKLTKAGTTSLSYADPVGDAVSSNDVITVVPGAAYTTRLISTGKTKERSGVPFAVTPVVQLVDMNGNDVEAPNIGVTASIIFGCTQARLSNNTATSDRSGRATFTNLTLVASECGFVIGFRPKDGAGPGALSVSLSYGLPAAIQIATQPAGARNRIPLTTQPAVTLKDSAGNTSKTKDVLVTATLDGSTVSARSDDDGRVTFTGLTASGRIGVRYVTFRSDGFADVASSAFVMSAGVASQMVPSETSISVAQGGALPYLKVKDVDGNDTDLAESVIVEASSTSGTTWVSGLRVRTALSGVVGFSGAKVWSTSNRATLKFVVQGRAISTSVSVGFTRVLTIGDQGPAGGMVIARLTATNDYNDFAYGFTSQTGLSAGGHYIEAAPPGWWPNSSVDPKMVWGTKPLPSERFGSSEFLGFAALNARLYLEHLAKPTMVAPATSAIGKATTTVVGDYDDWLLPTAVEIGQMLELAYEDNSILGLELGQGSSMYWSSSVSYERGLSRIIAMSPLSGAYSFDSLLPQSASNFVRPIRYFD